MTREDAKARLTGSDETRELRAQLRDTREALQRAKAQRRRGIDIRTPIRLREMLLTILGLLVLWAVASKGIAW